MLLGWRLFYYRKRIRSQADYRSACNSSIFPYGQTIFKSAETDALTIYTNASKQLEMFLVEGAAEVRLSVWEVESTKTLLLERFALSDISAAGISELRAVKFTFRCITLKDGIGEREFTVCLYREADAAALLQNVSLDGEAAAIVAQLNELTGGVDSSCVAECDVHSLEELTIKIRRLSSNEK
ncbi:hypothetical protein PAPHI01_1106 [Pancytospora philotis]|nr:hypothetical protein PAPHI01_1106 [Pancytospora philotis]